MADGLARLLAPILSFTADELWRYLPGAREESVHLALFPRRQAELEPLRDPALLALWERLIEIRDQVLAQIEPLRKDKQIGSSLQAKVVAVGRRRRAGAAEAITPTSCRCCSSCRKSSCVRTAGDALQVTIETRIWRQMRALLALRAHSVGGSGRPGICERCQDALAESRRS